MNEMKILEAVKCGDRQAVELLLMNGADPNQRDEQGWTPLNFAAGIGNLPLVQLLVENGADVFMVGRDLRTPYSIALAAKRVSVVKYLKEVEDRAKEKKPAQPPRDYCKGYPLAELRKFSSWREGRVNWRHNDGNVDSSEEPDFTDDKIVFIHRDLTVTESIWRGQNIIFQDVDSAWEEYCANALCFKPPGDLDLIGLDETND